MNDEQIFIKTPTGEDAVRDRTRLVQRNLRMVLILVDGLTKVAALKQKAGDPAMIETALAELERIGLIEAIVVDRREPGPTFPAEIAIDEAIDTIDGMDSHDDFPTVDTVFEEIAPIPPQRPNDIHGPAKAFSPLVGVLTSPHAVLPRDSWFTRTRRRWHQMREERAYEKAYGTPSIEDREIASVRRKPFPRRIKFKLKSVITIALAGLMLIGVARLFFYPYDEHRPAIEAQLSKMLGDDVSIGSIGLAFEPLPALRLQQVVVGRTADATAESVSVVPEIDWIVGGQPFRTARIRGLEIRERAIGKLGKWFLPENAGDIRLDRLDIEGMSIEVGGTRFPGITGSLRPGVADVFLFAGRAGQSELQFEVAPAGDGLSITAKAGQWVLPVDPPLNLVALDFSGTLSTGKLSIEKVDARLFDGLMSGTGLVAWEEGTPKITLDMTMEHVAAAKLLQVLGAPALVEGELDGRMQYVNSAPSARWLNQNAKVTGNVSIVRGSLKRIDLASALKTSDGQRSTSRRGGETGFEDLKGKFSLDAGSVRVTDVRLSSGLMLASGQATVSRESGLISGAVNVEMRGSARAPRASVSIGGEAKDPELTAGR